MKSILIVGQAILSLPETGLLLWGIPKAYVILPYLATIGRYFLTLYTGEAKVLATQRD